MAQTWFALQSREYPWGPRRGRDHFGSGRKQRRQIKLIAWLTSARWELRA